MTHPLTLRLLPDQWGVVKLAPSQPFPTWLDGASLWFAARTEDELSVMCPQALIPPELAYSANWRCLRLDGDLPFDVVGIVAGISTPLAEAGLSLLVVSTHDRDYVLVQHDDLETALAAYRAHGFHLLGI